MRAEVQIEKLAFGGEGIARIDGKVCFVEGALPGETVRITEIKDKKKFYRAKAGRVLIKSPERVEPPCPYYGDCGGCQYQHMSYTAELKAKEDQVRERFVRDLKADPDLFGPIQYGDQAYHYRNSVTLHRTEKSFHHPQRLGLFACDNETVLPIKECLLGDKRLKPVYESPQFMKKGKDEMSFRLSDQGEIHSSRDLKFFRVKVGGKSLLTSTRGFFQANLAVTAMIVKKLREWIRSVSPETFIDLYSGVGTFSLLAAGEVPKKLCVEENPDSLDALRINISDEPKSKYEILEGRVEKIFPKSFDAARYEKSFLFLDPPRSGMALPFSRYIGREGPFGSVAYLSCNLASLIRDLKIILEAGKYRIVEIVPYDMFARTKHIEVLTLLQPA